MQNVLQDLIVNVAFRNTFCHTLDIKIFFSLAAQAVLTGSVASFLVCAPSQAAVVNVGGVLYDVTVLETSYTASDSTFQQPPLGQMPWWEDRAMARKFAITVFDLLGEGSTGGFGPYFAYTYFEIFLTIPWWMLPCKIYISRIHHR
jgi:hypothetical protein